MVFHDIHKHHGMARAHQRGTYSAANGAGTPDQDGAMINGLTGGVFFGVARHGILLRGKGAAKWRMAKDRAVACHAWSKAAG
jgi:hypothetical protein